MDFPIADLMDEDACYAKLVQWLHPGGLACPRCGARDGLGVHRRHRARSSTSAARRVAGSSMPSAGRPGAGPNGDPSSWS